MLHFTIKTAVWLQIPLSTSGPGLDADLADKTHHGRKGFLASCELHHVSQKTTWICKWCSWFQTYRQLKYRVETHVSSKGEPYKLGNLGCFQAGWQINPQPGGRGLSLLHHARSTSQAGSGRPWATYAQPDPHVGRLRKAQSNPSLVFILSQRL